jgi:cytochrome c nitrite reductase small subunit
MKLRFTWAISAAVALGIAAGLGAFTFVYAKGASYLTTDAASCANCHIMEEHYAAWLKSSHRNVARCADCHMPHDAIGKYAAKASNGFWHSLAFTTGRFPDPLQIKQHNRTITERTCRDCHGAVVDAIDAARVSGDAQASSATAERPSLHDGAVVGGAEDFSCIRCHKYVGHLVR